MVENEWRGEVHMEGNEKRIRDYGPPPHAASCLMQPHVTSMTLCHFVTNLLEF